MPNVTVLPKSGSDGKIQMEFFDTVGTTSVTYTYATTQKGISVKNLGTANLTLTISGESKTIQPKKTESYSGSFTSFAIVSASGLVPFFADAYELDNDNPNVKLTSLEADFAQLKESGGSADLTAVNARIDLLADPVTTTFSVTNPNAPVEVGTTLSGVTFAWGITNYTGVKTAEIKADATVLETLSAASGTVTKAFSGAGYKSDTASSLSYTLHVEDTNKKVIDKTVSISWQWAVYSGSSASTSLDEAGIEALTKALKSGYAGTYTFAASAGYKYICYPSALGTATTFKDASTGLNVPMSAVTTLSITNANGVATTYNINRTTNIINGAINIAVSA